MKKVLINIFAMTGLTLVILALIASLYNANFLCISTVYQCFGVNIILYLGLKIVQKFETKYFIIETLLDVTFLLCILIPAGYLFKWYSSTPLWVVILMGFAIYAISCFVNVLRVNEDISFINNQLKNNQNHE